MTTLPDTKWSHYPDVPSVMPQSRGCRRRGRLGGSKSRAAGSSAAGLAGKGVQCRLEGCGDGKTALFERVQDRHHRFARPRAGLGLRAEGYLACDDGGSQVALGEVIVGRDRGIAQPAIEGFGILVEDLLDLPDRRMPRLAVGDRDDAHSGARGAPEESLA